FPGMKVGTVDLASDAIHMLPLFRNCKNINPQFAPDSQSVYFISNAEGVPDVYRYYFADSRIQRVTHVDTGVSGITEMSPALSVSHGSGEIALSLYENDNYNIYKLEPSVMGPTVTTALPPEAARAAQLTLLRGGCHPGRQHGHSAGSGHQPLGRGVGHPAVSVQRQQSR